MNKFEKIIAREPSKSIINGVTTSPELGSVNYELASQQHKDYLNILENLGLEIYVIPKDERFPDSVFV